MNEHTDRKAVHEAAAVERTCRVCGCTDLDCSHCIRRTGGACRWVAADLCSACTNDDPWLIKVERGSTIQPAVARVTIGRNTWQARAAAGERSACERLALKVAQAVRADRGWYEQYRVASQKIAVAYLCLDFLWFEHSIETRDRRG